MMHDLRLLACLRGRQMGNAALYWLRAAGYEPESRDLSERLYAVYLACLGTFWVVAMAAIAFHEAAHAGQMLRSAGAVDPALAALPWLVLAGQVLLAANALRTTPLKLSFPDMAYVAGSPIARPAPVLVAFLMEVARNLLVGLPAAAVLGVVLAGPVEAGMVHYSAALRPALAALPLVILSSGAAWCLGLARLAIRWMRRCRVAWLAPLALFPLACLVPGALLWPGRILASAMGGLLPTGSILWLLLPAVGTVALVACLGQWINMADVVAESHTYARLRALGVVAWLAPDTAQTIRRQAALAGRRPFLRLPATSGAHTLVARPALGMLRQPGSLAVLLLWSVLTAQAASWMVLPAAYPALWVPWLSVILLAPAGALVGCYQTDMAEPFLRQFLPVDNLHLLLTDVAAPLTLTTLGALALWLSQAPTLAAAVVGVVLIIALTLLLALCQGAPVAGIGLWRLRPPYPAVAGISFGAVIVAANALQTPLAAVATALALAASLAALVARTRSWKPGA